MGYATYTRDPATGSVCMTVGTVDVTGNAGLDALTTEQVAARTRALAADTKLGAYQTVWIEWPYCDPRSRMNVATLAKLHVLCSGLYAYAANPEPVLPSTVKRALSFPQKITYAQRKTLGAKLGAALAAVWDTVAPGLAGQFNAQRAKAKEDSGDALIILTWCMLGRPALLSPEGLVLRLSSHLAQESLAASVTPPS